MDGISGKPAWAWIFILEGLFTVLVGIASFWVIQDFPETAKFLTEEESWHAIGFSFCLELMSTKELLSSVVYNLINSSVQGAKSLI